MFTLFGYIIVVICETMKMGAVFYLCFLFVFSCLFRKNYIFSCAQFILSRSLFMFQKAHHVKTIIFVVAAAIIRILCDVIHH